MTSISAERFALKKIGGDLILREDWNSRFDYTDPRTVVEPAKQIFIHITVTEPNNYNSHEAHVRAIEAIGISRFGNTGGSYNRIIVAGVNRAYELQPVGRRGAHTVNNFGYSTCRRFGSQCPGYGGTFDTGGWGTNLNYSARAYAYGANTYHSVTNAVLHTFAKAIAADIKAGFVRRDAKIHGHRCVSSKSCPGDKMWAEMHELERLVNDYLEDDMSWNENIEPTGIARDIQPEAWVTTAGRQLNYAAAGLAWMRNTDGITQKVWRTDDVVKAPPSYVEKHPSNPHWYAERYLSEIWEHGHALRDVPDRLAALEAAVQGSDAESIKTLITERHDAADQQRQVMADTMTAKLDAIVDATKGADPAEAKLAAILEILGVEQTD